MGGDRIRKVTPGRPSAFREHRLLLTLHDLVIAAWSLNTVLRELATLYGGSAMPAAALRCPGYAVWQRESLHEIVLDDLLNYWRDLLEPDQVLDLPTDRQRPARRNFRGGVATSRVAPCPL
jgi:hypothetical protein